MCLFGSDELWVYDQIYPWILFESSLNSFMYDCYSFVFLSDLLIWLGQLDWFFLQWERCFVMGSILGCWILVTERDMTHIFIVAIKDKRMGFIHVWVYFFYIMSSCLRRYSILYELDTLDACWIAIDVWSNSSRCRIILVYLSRTWCLYMWSLPWISSWLFAFLSVQQ